MKEASRRRLVMGLRKVFWAVPFAPSALALLRLAAGRKARFASDYRKSSGVGSTVEAASPIIEALPGVIDSFAIRSILDVPCGDFVWMRVIDLSSVDYIGADIIDTLVESHQRDHASARRQFRTLDVVKDDLPRVDIVLCRDCLVHFSDRLVKKALANIQRSGSRYLLTTTFPAHLTNTNIVTGDWRPINLCAEPFNFPSPLQMIHERNTAPYDDKGLALWRISDLPTF
jgi:hypothetical protein